MSSTTFIRLAASTIIAVGGIALARPALASAAKTPCDPGAIDNLASEGYSYCSAHGFDSVDVSVSCSNGQITGVTVTCSNYNN
jgi:hypothetical protein